MKYKNTIIPINNIVLIVWGQVMWQDYYDDLRYYVESYVELRTIPSK